MPSSVEGCEATTKGRMSCWYGTAGSGEAHNKQTTEGRPEWQAALRPLNLPASQACMSVGLGAAGGGAVLLALLGVSALCQVPGAKALQSVKLSAACVR